MADSFATVNDYVQRWPLRPSQENRCDVLLGDASLEIREEVARAGRDLDAEIASGVVDPGTPRLVVLAMVRRALLTPEGAEDSIPASTVQQSWGPFQQSITPVNPTGDLYLTKRERRRLGLNRQRAFTINQDPSAVI